MARASSSSGDPGTPCSLTDASPGGTCAVWFLYAVRTIDGCLYAVVATDVPRRFNEHVSQGRKAAKYLRAHKPATLAFSQAIGGRSLALKVEYQFKRLTKSDKETIIRKKKLHFDPATGRIVSR